MLATESTFDVVIPIPGFCLKTKDEENNKVFLNVCSSDKVPEPQSISEDELLLLLEKEEHSDYKIPMSIGESHAEFDNTGAGCTVYDVIVATNFLNNLEQKRVLMSFFLTVLLEGLESKYTIQLSREWKILKNRKSVGVLQKQNIRKSSKPRIEEIGGSTASFDEITEVPYVEKAQIVAPVYAIKKDPPTGQPEYLCAEFQLPNVKSANALSLTIGEDRIILETRSNAYFLDIFIPYNIIQEESGAQFDLNAKILTLTMPVKI